MISKNAKVLVVDDDNDVLVAVKMLLKPEVKEVVTEKNPERILSILSKDKFDVILLDMNYKSALNTGNEGFFWLKKILEKDKEAVVIMITAYGDVELAVRSLKEGATDFILKPWRNDKMLATIADAYQKSQNKSKKQVSVEVKENHAPAPKEGFSFSELIGNSEVMMDVRKKIEKVAPTDANVLILGENGTGKELIARALHKFSLRADKPFVSVDLGSLTDTLFESELFGHKKGAYTDAKEDRVGRIETASGGTLFLDEIGNIAMPHQAKLLTVLQNRQVTRLGTNKPVDIDIRLICATNMPIYEMATQNKFRKDLIYRVNTVEITLPPLRQRGDDIIVLAEHFAGIYAKKYNKPVPQFEEATIKKLKQYSWHGNVRELQHAVERAVIMAERSVLRPDDFVFTHFEATPEVVSAGDALRLDEMEKNTILRVIEKHQGNITKAARELGITRTALYRRLEKHDI
ncbi:sigma-54 dependent transcriptional regulator [Rhodocytophaga aerolata]|uniref:Sigma-54 dependent transcriptional regulator n=1 Tax=Rhodocytophaga aerolata TaxID=455078 RepID=A0ABT8RAL2_9BACT|nr:sigma-54 dependent transcriptional regulator [Rhodocytophaga aerolata]MDO1449100.1 sigma-54 dependent transcriptional regulator [Rhodocytophaga aerolata]